MHSPFVISDVSIATMNLGPKDYGLLQSGAIVIEAGLIVWVGDAADCPAQYSGYERYGFEGRLVTPALIDCHTHIVHGGNRAREFEMRLNGKTYEEVSRAGGGIISSVTDTRNESFDQLLHQALGRVDALISEGIATIEIKSGYGLDLETELKMLRIARAISSQRSVEIVTTFLGAHTVPAGMDADIYIDKVCIPTLEAAYDEGLVDAVDGFCENIAFSPAQISRVFDTAQKLGLPVKLHAEQLSRQGGAALAATYKALSADHLEYATDIDAQKMALADMVAVLLPGAFYTLHEIQKPPVEAFRKHNVPMAVATDWNPGSSPLGSLLLAMNMACTLFQLTPQEALAGTTRNAAKALGLPDRGMIKAGLRADLAIWDVKNPGELSYGIGVNPLCRRVFAGEMA